MFLASSPTRARTRAASIAIVSPALEHGNRGRPGPGLVTQIASYFELIWDEVDELKRLAQLSHPRVPVETGGLSPKATLFANLLAKHIHELDEATLVRMLAEMGYD